MQKAKELTQELIENQKNSIVHSVEENFSELKPEINNLLHVHLPGDITIDETEVLSMVIFNIITDPKKFLNN